MSTPLSQDAIVAYVRANFDGVDIEQPQAGSDAPEIAQGDTFFIYDPERKFEGAGRFPLATIITKDYPDDELSRLNSDSAYRLNIGASKETFDALVGDADDVDHAARDVVVPHPVYGRMHWVSVVNPSEATLEGLKPALREAYEISVSRVEKGNRG